jgi:hypothetical protein
MVPPGFCVFGKTTRLQSPIERVIQITQERLDHWSTEDAARRKMTAYRLQTPCDAGSKPAQAESWRYQCDLNHIADFEPVLSSQHQNVMHATLQAFNSED